MSSLRKFRLLLLFFAVLTCVSAAFHLLIIFTGSPVANFLSQLLFPLSIVSIFWISRDEILQAGKNKKEFMDTGKDRNRLLDTTHSLVFLYVMLLMYLSVSETKIDIFPYLVSNSVAFSGFTFGMIFTIAITCKRSKSYLEYIAEMKI